MNDFTPQKQPDMRADLSVMEATGNAYIFVKEHYHTLIKWAVFPIIISFLSYVVIDWQDVEADGRLKSFLFSLPATAAFAWYVFVQTRLQVFGEYAGRLPLDDGFAARRRTDMTVSISFYILFQMAMALITFALSAKMTMPEGQDAVAPEQMIIITAGLVISFWVLKYGLLHLVTAVGAGVRDYLKRVRGMWFSFVLLAVGFASCLPILLIFMFILSLTIPDSETATTSSRFGLYAVGTIMSWSVVSVLNAALVDVLRQLFTKDKNNER